MDPLEQASLPLGCPTPGHRLDSSTPQPSQLAPLWRPDCRATHDSPVVGSTALSWPPQIHGDLETDPRRAHPQFGLSQSDFFCRNGTKNHRGKLAEERDGPRDCTTLEPHPPALYPMNPKCAFCLEASQNSSLSLPICPLPPEANFSFS